VFSLAATTCLAATATAAPPAPSPSAQTSKALTFTQRMPTSTVKLPTGETVDVYGSGHNAQYLVVGPDGMPVAATKYDVGNGHFYVIPASASASTQPLDMSKFDIPALASSAPTKPTLSPRYPMHILQVNATDLTGAPAASAITYLVNTDGVQRWSIPVRITNGVGRIALPAGHYATFTQFVETVYDGTPGGRETTHLVIQDDFDVPQTGGVTTLTADERAASSEVTAATPRPTKTVMAVASFFRTDVAGQTGIVQVGLNGPLWVSPQPKPRLGTLGYQLVWGGAGGTGTKDPYHYDLMYPPVDHVDANQTWPVDPHKLATQHNSFDADPAMAGNQGTYGLGFFLADNGGMADAVYPDNPSRMTEYVSAPLPGASWNEQYTPAIPKPDPGTVPAFLSFWPRADASTFTPGTETWVSWGHGPLTPQVGQVRGVTSYSPCPACAEGSTLDMGFMQMVDSEPDHQAFLFGPATQHFTLYQNGSQVFDQGGATGAEVTGVPSQGAAYRAVFDQDLSAFGLSQSTATHTDVTFQYRPTGLPALPAGDLCQAQGASSTPCQILPVLNLRYQLKTDATNTGHSPVQKLELTVGHEQFDGRGSHAAVTGATVSVSFDGGKTWTAARVERSGDDRFTAMWANAAAKGATPWLKVTATDAVGGTISQTVENAYTIGSNGGDQ
jgi:hypothetical protein